MLVASCPTATGVFPLEIVAEILRHVARSALSTLRECMAACKAWRAAVSDELLFFHRYDLEAYYLGYPKPFVWGRHGEDIGDIVDDRWQIWVKGPLVILEAEFGFLRKVQLERLRRGPTDGGDGAVAALARLMPGQKRAPFSALYSDFRRAASLATEWDSISDDGCCFGCPILLAPSPTLHSASLDSDDDVASSHEIERMRISLLDRFGVIEPVRYKYRLLRFPVDDREAIVDYLGQAFDSSTYTPPNEDVDAANAAAEAFLQAAIVGGATRVLVCPPSLYGL
ncbi:hypothetical protein HDU86_001590 [Geranomyces michiganensis]|nr:hypothetical protein HDU86_001590 [Geranomyces michiganensis]